jgi:sugar lactone lactonase YvrE
MPIANALYSDAIELGMQGGIARTPAGELYVMAVGLTDALPVGTIVRNGIARHPDGYLYVVIS